MKVRLVLLAAQTAGLAIVAAAGLVHSAVGKEPALAQAPPSVDEMLPDLKLLEPFWRSRVVHRESVLFVRDAESDAATGTLLFAPEKVLAVRSADGRQTFDPGVDYRVSADGMRLELTAGSRIPSLSANDLFPPKGAPRSLPHVAGDPSRHVLFDNEHWFHDRQVEVTYERADNAWSGYAPKFAGEQLPKTLAKLRKGADLMIAVSGDSISAGYNASLFVKAPPYMPPYPDLVGAQLRATYRSKVTVHNRAVSGWRGSQGLEDLAESMKTKPDLVIVAYGMNDVGSRDVASFGRYGHEFRRRILAANPQAEIVFVAPMLGNEKWVHTPREMFPKYRDSLVEALGPGIALADMTALWTDLLEHKREVDLTGNGVNHPCDFGHRLYAQVILGLLIDKEAPVRAP